MTPEERAADLLAAAVEFVRLAQEELGAAGQRPTVYRVAQVLGVSQSYVADRLSGRRPVTDETLATWVERWSESRPEGAAALRLIHDGRRRVERV